jgi:hypothetical protein
MSPYVFLGATQALLIARGRQPFCDRSAPSHVCSVYALYERNKQMLYILNALYISSFVCSIITFSISLRHPMTYDGHCDVLEVHDRWIYFATA